MLLIFGSIIFIVKSLKFRALNITLEETGPLTADLKVMIESADYSEQVKSELKKHAKKANIPGFRPGKVPVQVVRKMMGTSVVIEEINKILAKSVQEYIESEELDLLGDPLPKDRKKEEDFDPNAQKDMEFVFEVGMAPQFELDLNLPELPELHQVEIDEKFLEKEIDMYREHFGNTTTPEEFQMGDIVFGQVFEVDENGEAIEEGLTQMLPLNPKRVKNTELFKKFEGGKLEDAFDFDLNDLSEDKKELEDILFVEEDVVEALQSKKLKFRIKRLNRVTRAEMNEDFFKKVSEQQKMELEEGTELTEELIREKMKESLETQLNEIAKTRFKNKLSEALINHHPLEFPDEFLKKWLLSSNEEATEESVENDYPKFIQDLTYTLIESKAIQKFDIKVEAEEVEDALKRNLIQSLMQSGMPADDNMLNSYMQYAKQDRDTMSRMFRSTLTNNVLDKLHEEFNPELTLINASDFVELK